MEYAVVPPMSHIKSIMNHSIRHVSEPSTYCTQTETLAFLQHMFVLVIGLFFKNKTHCLNSVHFLSSNTNPVTQTCL